MTLTVIIPAYNERETIETIIDRVARTPFSKTIVVVDDGSTDGTPAILKRLEQHYAGMLQCVYNERNRGKGHAIKSGLERATGEIVVIQDADLEYHPEEYGRAIELIENGWADAVYGSRFLGVHRVFLFWHYVGNKALTLVANLITSGMLTDMETGFKVIRSDVFRRLDIRSYTFDFEVEVTVKLFRYGFRVYEMPITYTGRGYEEGKKITWRDGVRALFALLKWGIMVRRRSLGSPPPRPAKEGAPDHTALPPR
jgi:glycosyltransferase involved in cell wall biosynthesis